MYVHSHVCPKHIHTNNDNQIWLGPIALVWHRPYRNQKDLQLFGLD